LLEWKTEKDSEFPSAQGSLQYLDSKLFVFGGVKKIEEGVDEMTDVLRYDLKLQEWITIKTEGFLPKVQFSSYVYDGTFYAFPGWSQSRAVMQSTVQTWKLGQKTWKDSDLQSFELAEYGFFALASSVYIFSGRSSGGLTNGLTLIKLSKSESQVLTASSSNPGPLSYPSLTSISQFIVLFGGVTPIGRSNELWTFDILSLSWNKVQTSGDLPSPRSHCGISSQGDTLVVWGGKSETGPVNDMFLLNFKSKYWIQIPVSSELQPSARYGPCIALDLPFFYLFGGKASDGISSTLWKFDFESFTYSIVKSNSKLEAGFNQYCELVNDEKKSLFIAFGTGALDKPLGNVTSFDFGSNKWTTLFEATEEISRSDSVIFHSNNELFILGGQSWSSFLYKNILKVDLGLKSSESLSKDLEKYLYASGGKFLRDSLYIYGGGGYFSTVPQPFESLSQFFQVNIKDLCPSCAKDCGPGSYFSDSQCFLCPAGTFSMMHNSTSCESCPVGTASKVKGASSERQCYPCDEGFYSDVSGSSSCLKCAEGFNCPVGSSISYDNKLNDYVESEQPKMLTRKTEEAARIGGAIQIAVFVLGFFILFVLIFTEKTRKIIKTIDMYTDKHNYELDVPMIKTKTFFGSFFSMVFIIVALILVIQTIILYQLDNESESKRLIPVVIIQDTLDNGFLADFNIKLSLHNYGGKCSTSKNTCVQELSVSLNSIKRNSYSTSCKKTSENTCIFELSCNTCQVSVESTILFSMKESFSYSTAVELNFTSDSSIPDKPSKISTLKTSEKGKLLRGPDPTIFFFSLIPSLFEKDGKDEKTGYHVTSEAAAVEGTSVTPEQFGFTSYQYVLVKVSSDNNALFTERKTIYTLFLLIMALIGSVVGMMNIIGGAMGFVEGNYLAKKTAFDKDKKNQQLKDNRKMALKNLTTDDDYTRGDI
jgi:hypothetical protein